MERIKFGRLEPDGTDAIYRHPDVYDWEETTGPTRLVIAPRAGHVDLLVALTQCWRGPFWLLYVLSVPSGDEGAGRYQSPEPMERPAVEAFLNRYREFLEGDARHALWVMSAAGEGTLVYDQHNLIYAYGPIECFEDVVTARGIRRGDVKLPAPHSHHYHREHDTDEEQLLAATEWIKTPLRDGDDE